IDYISIEVLLALFAGLFPLEIDSLTVWRPMNGSRFVPDKLKPSHDIVDGEFKLAVSWCSISGGRTCSFLLSNGRSELGNDQKNRQREDDTLFPKRMALVHETLHDPLRCVDSEDENSKTPKNDGEMPSVKLLGRASDRLLAPSSFSHSIRYLTWAIQPHRLPT